MTKIKGKIKWYSTDKGFGFVEGEDGEDYFLHHSQVPPATILQENDEVSFEAVETERGKQAQNLEIVE